MNAFIEHHQPSLRFDYSCFDRILLNGVIQVLQNPACVVRFRKEKRQADRVTPAYFRALSTDAGAPDELVGGLGLDWFWVSKGDLIKDKNTGGAETQTNATK
jgi:hypothetical protein